MRGKAMSDTPDELPTVSPEAEAVDPRLKQLSSSLAVSVAATRPARAHQARGAF